MNNIIFNKYLIFVLSAIWVIIPCFRENMPLDCVEAISWGKSFAFGYNKHPPLSGWLSYLAFNLYKSDLSIYILSQLCMIVTYCYIYLISQELGFDRKKKYLSILLLFGSFYFTFASPEFNVNVLLLPFWSGFIYHSYIAVVEKKYNHFILVAIFSALCILSKYIGALIVISICIYIIFNKSTWHIVKSKYLYIGFVVFVIIILPHMYWLVENDFITFHYALKRGDFEHSLISHIINPLHFLASQILAMVGTIVSCLAIYGFKFEMRTLSLKEKFVSYSFISPIAIMCLLSFIFGLKLISMWGLGMLGLLPTFIILINNKGISHPKLGVSVMLIFYSIAVFGYIYGIKNSKVPNFPGRILANSVSKIWKEKVGTDLKYVGGDVWYGGNVSVYSDGDVKKLYIDMDSNQNTWINHDDLKKHGIVIIARNQDEMNSYKKIYPNIEQLNDIEIPMHGKLYQNKINFKIAIIKPV
jgi:4-amino-4-deoxy-L-arabinose transferase-like glycosyltransferase